MLNSSGNPIHKILILITTSALGIGLYFLMSNSKIQVKNSSEPYQESNTTNTADPKNLQTTENDSNPTTADRPAGETKAIDTVQPTASPEPDYFDSAKASERDQKHFQEITRKTNIQIQKQMRQEEITSLKESIENDKALLKKIEESGSGIEDYKYIEQNLKKRIQRLRQLEVSSRNTDNN